MTKAVFLDRDGVINKYPGHGKYVTGWKGFRFLPRAKEAIAQLTRAGFRIFVVSNQAGVNKGLFSKKALGRLTGNMLGEIEKAGGRIDEVYYCVHRSEENCPCRKPKHGSLEAARRKYRVRLKGSFFIGDTMTDMLTAHNAGCASILVLSGGEKLSNRKNWDTQPGFIFRDLYQAVQFILGLER
ncbi:MAG: HAD family hydrolase [Candidatus Omnitrophota bacterium]|jgi:D-glycero-D-manno-heptose 1,7-bisphosphate phosphatase